MPRVAAALLCALTLLWPRTAAAQDPAEPAGSVTPAQSEIHIPAGGRQHQDYLVDLTAVERTLDVFFLIDTSSSMDPAIIGLRRGVSALAKELNDAGIDVHFGLGEFQDMHEIRYRRRLDISPLDHRLEQELDDIRTAGGAEPHLTALYQMATGAGIGTPRHTGKPVAPGGDAHWRPGSLRVVVTITDEPHAVDPDTPPEAAVMASLNAKDVRHVGIEMGDQPTTIVGGVVGRSVVYEELARWSEATGGLAPSHGVDCNGDGLRDVEENAPLVCTVPHVAASSVAGMSKSIAQMLLALEDRRSVEFRTVDAAAATHVEPPVYPDVDMRVSQRLGFRAVFSCTEGQGGQSLGVTLAAVVGGRVVGTAQATVVCVAPPRRTEWVAVLGAPPPVGAGAAPLPVPATSGATAQASSTAGAQAGATAQASVAQPAGALAVAPVPEPQPAYATAERRSGGGPATAAAAGATAVAAAWAAQSAARTTTASSRSARRP